MKFVYLVYIVASTTWSPAETLEYKMPSMEVCLESVKVAKISNSEKGRTVTVFCIFKDR